MLNLFLLLLSNLGGPLLGLLPVVWAFIQKHWKAVLFDVAIVGVVFNGYQWHRTDVQLKVEKAAHAADIKAFSDAQAQADKNAKDIAKKLTDDGKTKANEADKNYSTLLAKYNASLVRYKANQGSSGQSNSGQLSTPTGSDGPGASAQLSITVGDAQICATNTARLQSVHDWAVQLSLK